MGEFELIDRYFRRPARRQPLGVGDDCALLAPTPGMQMAVSTDLLIEGRHFLSTADPERLGHKCLAVNLSDLAACGAQPMAFTLALSLPRVEETWLQAFAKGLFALADAHGCELVGGDTTRGPLAIGITVFGEVPTGQALLRSGAQVGDEVWVSGQLGDARLALEAFRGRIELPTEVFRQARARMEQPTPRVALALALRAVAHAAIDVSDGLSGDLSHVLRASGVGATLDGEALRGLLGAGPVLSHEQQLDLVLGGGDDYELVFTAAPAQHAAIMQIGQATGCPLQCIGSIEAQSGLRIREQDGRIVVPGVSSFDHFA